MGQNLERARTLCEEIGETRALIPVVIGLGRFHLMRAERVAVEEIAEQERHLLERIDDPALALHLHIHLGAIEICRGALHRAQEHCDQVLTLFAAERHQWLFLSFGGDPLAIALAHATWTAWLSGRPDQARAYIEKSFARAEEVSHPPTLTYALVTGAMAKLFSGKSDEAEWLAQRGVNLAREHGFSLHIAQGVVAQHCAMLQRGDLQAGLATIAEALSAYRATGARLFLPFFLAFLAQGYLRAGRVADGLRVVEEALHLTATNLDVFWEAELYRLKGTLTLQSQASLKQVSNKSQISRDQSPTPKSQLLNPNSQEEAEAYFQQALAIARRQGAKLLELRAVMSLVRLRQQQAALSTSRITYHVLRTTHHVPLTSHARNSPRHTVCYPISATGSPKGLTRRTCERPKRCLKN